MVILGIFDPFKKFFLRIFGSNNSINKDKCNCGCLPIRGFISNHKPDNKIGCDGSLWFVYKGGE